MRVGQLEQEKSLEKEYVPMRIHILIRYRLVQYTYIVVRIQCDRSIRGFPLIRYLISFGSLLLNGFIII